METFSCRNCVQNPMQGNAFGRGEGYCLQWGSVLPQPERTTCKYLHRKDLPRHLVDAGTAEHAKEFAACTGPTNLLTGAALRRIPYSEKHKWDTNTFEPTLHAIAMYHRGDAAETAPAGKWRFIQGFGGSFDARRAIAYSSLVRRYMHHCDSWDSSYRLVLAQVEDIGAPIAVPKEDLLSDNGMGERAAFWEVFFAQLSGLQEFGWHASLEVLRTPVSGLGPAVAQLDWDAVCEAVRPLRAQWQAAIIAKARSAGEYFPTPTAREG